MTELETLRRLDFWQRVEWHQKNAKVTRTGVVIVKVDGQVAAVGCEDDFESHLAKFLMFIARAV